MNATNFCYWLKGYFEISRTESLNEIQVQEIKNHLGLVFGRIIFQGADLTVENRNRTANGETVYYC